jgi:type II secretory pathway pseudopilin PulG
MHFGRSSFSLVELVIVVVIIGVITAIAVPRLSRSAMVAEEAALIRNLRTLRDCIDFYQADHAGLLPKKKADFVDQLTKYTDISGGASDTKVGAYVLGPYLRIMPALPLGKMKGDSRVTDGAKPGDKNDGGWWYNEVTGEIRANLKNDETDESGKPYNEY